ncbi:uncharacterized protein [Asterias amurensis]|uniref:uncharacterized protein n=1 Tax=Asterias amurensis TaxID=7602 RepID=UPI003AB33773
MEFRRLMWMLVIVLWMEMAVFGELQRQVVNRKVTRPCRAKAIGTGAVSNNTKVMLDKPCTKGENVPTTIGQDLVIAREQGNPNSQGSNATEPPIAPHETLSITRPLPPKKEFHAGGHTGVNSDEVRGPSGALPPAEEVEDTLDSLAPRKPYPERDSVGVVDEIPATTMESKVVDREEEFPLNKLYPNEKKSELFLDSGIFPFIAMGVLSLLFITMMIAALYFARNSAGGIHHAQLLGMKQVEMGHLHQRMAPPPTGPGAFNTVTFRNTNDSVTGDFAVNMFAVRNDEREEAERMSSDISDSTMVPTFAAITPKVHVTADHPAQRELEHTTSAVLHRDLPDVVSNPPSLCNSFISNRHSTGSSLYMELMNLSRNTRILEELAARKQTILVRDPTQLELDCVLPDLSDHDGDSKQRGGRLQLCRQTSLDSSRCLESLPLPCNYDSHYFKLYDADDDDSSARWTSVTANTTLENILSSGDEGTSSTLNSSSLHRKGSSKRNSRQLDESRFLLPVQELFNEAMVDDNLDGDEVLYETIDEMGYRRRTASSRLMRSLMAAREEAGQSGKTVVVENAWENAAYKKYDRIERGVKSLKKQSGKDYNSLVVKPS